MVVEGIHQGAFLKTLLQKEPSQKIFINYLPTIEQH